MALLKKRLYRFIDNINCFLIEAFCSFTSKVVHKNKRWDSGFITAVRKGFLNIAVYFDYILFIK